MGLAIAIYRRTTDVGVKLRMAKIYRHGQLIYVMSGDPMFAQAKREEVLRLEDELDKKQAKGKTQEETEKDASRVTKKLEEEIENKKEWQTGHRLKSRAKIPSTELNDEDSQPIPINHTIIPEAELKVDPGMNFHGVQNVPHVESSESERSYKDSIQDTCESDEDGDGEVQINNQASLS
ncbi:hypothetical protein ACET3Z_018005 [Daucus carota]